MKKSPTITKAKPESKAVDYAALYREGIEWAQRYSGALWTDYNLHDPGATLLEYLCFGLTDVGYRCGFPVTDLLYARNGQSIQWADNAFFSIDNILPCAPLTKDDYRRLILDHLVGQVDNVWVTSAKNNKEGFKGLYDIFVQIAPDALGVDKDRKQKEKDVAQAVRDLYNTHRNLSEDLNQVHILRQEDLDLEATISIEGDASAEQVLADMAYRIETFLAPKPKLYDFETLKEAGMEVNDILDGPKPKNGFTKPNELLRFALSLRVSQMKDNIVSVPGVVGVSRFLVKIKSVPQRDEDIALPLNTYFVLGTDIFSPDSTVRFLRNGREVKPNRAEARQLLLVHRAKNLRRFGHPVDLRKPTPLSEKNLADVANYFSIQRFFPAVYGIGAYGLPSDAGSLRKAQATQLKGYIAIFEVMLAGYLKQLTQLRDLFSTGKETEFVRPDMVSASRSAGLPPQCAPEPTYFAQFPFDIPDIAPLLDFPNMGDGETLGTSANQYLAKLAAQGGQDLEQGGQDLERRNTFMSHLLARFAETFDADLLSRLSKNIEDGDRLRRDLLEAKRRILREYDTLSRNRGLGFNYAQSGHIIGKRTSWGVSWASENVPTLKKNICYRLNLPYFEDRGLTDFFPFDGFGTQPLPKQEVPGHAVAISLRSLLRDGRSRSSYTIQATEGGGYEVCFWENKHTSNPLCQAETQQKAEDKLALFLEHLEAFQNNSNGFFIVEHLLLRPFHTKGTKLVLTVELSAPKTPFILESPEYMDAQKLDILARDVLLLASKTENFEVRNIDKLYSIVLKTREEDLMVSRGHCTTRKEADAIIRALAQKVQDAVGSSNLFKVNELLSSEEETIKGLEVPHEFYAHRLSVVAPNWADIFGDKGARQNFQDLVRQLAPAHLHLDFHWLNWREMKSFEADYMRWMYEKSNPATVMRTIDACSFRLVEFLWGRLNGKISSSD